MKTFFYYTTTKLLLLMLFVLINTGCETTELDLTTNPSALNPESADPDLLLNNIQIQFMEALAYNEDNEDGLNVRASEFVRMQHLFGAYSGPFSLTSGRLDEFWENMYRETLQDIEVLIPLAERRGLNGYIGVAKIIKAYTYVLLVDSFGDVPFTETLLGNTNPNPKLDSGAEIYDAMLAIIDEGISVINSEGALMPQDLFFQGNKEKWTRLANTLKFKMFLQKRLIEDHSSDINTLINSGLITEASHDFQFQYSTVDDASGDSRHPYYALNYDADGVDDYLNSYYVNLLLKEKGFSDPRLRYYFYRQTTEEPSGDNLECDGESGFNFCYLGDLYWTRDHGDDSGVPPDQTLRSTYGLYPIGGAFDNDSFESVTQNKGAGGAGVFPIMLSSYVKFMLAESALTLGTTGNPRDMLQEAIQESMDKVLNFNSSQVDASFAASSTDVSDYIDYVLNSYDSATTDEERLDIIIKEYYIALWGNGIEAWNNYRRTSYPSDLSLHVATPGAFPRTLLYPAATVNSNSSITQKAVTIKTFWDTNPDNIN